MTYQTERANEHVAATVEQLSRLYDEHERETSRIQRLANNFTARLAEPIVLIAVMGLMMAWIVGNLVARPVGWAPLDEFPFPSLEFIATVTALLVALLILTTQRSQDELADRRARLTLQIAALSEKKIAKVIELLEEQRRDNPLLPARTDSSADQMAVSTDPSNELTSD